MNRQIENRYYPDRVSAPGETLLETLEDRGISQADLARRMGRPHKTINEIIRGKAAITPETAIQLETVLGVPAHFWSSRQLQFDQHVARREELERLDGYRTWLSAFPISQMVRYGWIHQRSSKAEQVNELLRFLGVASPEQWEQVYLQTEASFRKSRSHASAPEHVSCWLRRGEIAASKLTLAPFDGDAFRKQLATSIRGLTRSEPETFQTELPAICSRVGVAVAFVPELPKARVSGATRWLSQDRALVQLSLRYRTDDQLWFTFFHEAAHIILHGKRDIFLEGTDVAEPGEQEDQADRFAANALISPDDLDNFLAALPADRYPSESRISDFAQTIGVAPGIVVGRLQHDRLPAANPISFSHYNHLKKRFRWRVDSA